MYPEPGIGKPACRLAVGHTGAQSFGDGGRFSFGARFEPGDGILRPCEGSEEGMRVIGRGGCSGRRPRPARRLERVVGFPNRPPPRFIIVLLYASYSEFAKTKNERHPMAREWFGRFMASMGATPAKHRNGVVGEHVTDVTINHQRGDTKRLSALIKKPRATGYRIGTLTAARDAFSDFTKLPVAWEATDTGIEEVD
jgi:hypothetical protein